MPGPGWTSAPTTCRPASPPRITRRASTPRWPTSRNTWKPDSPSTRAEVPMTTGRVEWADHVVWWHAYPLRLVGAEQSLGEVEGVAHRLPRLEAWLDHLISLGANGLLL